MYKIKLGGEWWVGYCKGDHALYQPVMGEANAVLFESEEAASKLADTIKRTTLTGAVPEVVRSIN